MDKKFEIRQNEQYEAQDAELNHLNAMVEGKMERKKLAVPISGFTYFHYESEESFKSLEDFCTPYKVQKTKKFQRNGTVN
ncbi:hypothetical protein D920_00402, partial [Enterococcus faecalis 13-SD-W-01]